MQAFAGRSNWELIIETVSSSIAIASGAATASSTTKAAGGSDSYSFVNYSNFGCSGR